MTVTHPTNHLQVKDMVARPLPFKQEQGWTGQKPELSHSTDSLKPEPALATLSASNNSSNSDLAALPVFKDSTPACNYDKEAEDDLTYQVILQLLQR